MAKFGLFSAMDSTKNQILSSSAPKIFLYTSFTRIYNMQISFSYIKHIGGYFSMLAEVQNLKKCNDFKVV